MAQFIRKALRAILNYDPSFCDMYEDEHARAVSAEYLGPIRKHLHGHFGDQKLTILDAGCQAGRCLIPLAEEGHHLIGIDASSFAIRRAQRHARQRRVSATFYRGDLAKLTRWIAPASLDAVVCIEVLYLCHNYRALLQRLMDSLKPYGIAFVAHRPALYFLATAFRRHVPEQAAFVATHTDGASPEGAYHNWQTPEQLRELYRGLHCTLLQTYPIEYTTLQLDLSTVTAPEVRSLLEPCRNTDSTCSIPSYVLAVVQKTEPHPPAATSHAQTLHHA